MPDKWYQSWFNSPYYHVLYSQHNDSEAEFFIDNLCSKLQPSLNARVLDIACGRGRHSIYLNKKGFDVTGIDLSHSNVIYAKRYQNETLHFYEHDMRHLLYINYFDLALNLFTSFGYFESESDHVKALQAFRKSLKPDGLLVLDYFNSSKILSHLTNKATKRVDGISFHITKHVNNGKVNKTINFEDKGQHHEYKEEVVAFSLGDFKRIFALSGFEIVHYYGDYSLSEYEETISDRLIFICKKADV